jgi:hypothetical protein
MLDDNTLEFTRIRALLFQVSAGEFNGIEQECFSIKLCDLLSGK